MKRLLLFIVALTAAAGGLRANGAQENSFGPPDSDRRILVAYESTRFKRSLVGKMISELDDGTVYIELEDHGDSKLEGRNAADYDAVFITNSGVTAKVRPWISSWIEANNNAANILLHTTQRTVWEPAVSVDSITSASLQGETAISDLAREYISRLREKL